MTESLEDLLTDLAKKVAPGSNDTTKLFTEFASFISETVGTVSKDLDRILTVFKHTSDEELKSLRHKDSESEIDMKSVVTYAREKCLDFNRKDLISVLGKGTEGTRFADATHHEAISQKVLDDISSRIAEKQTYAEILAVMYINRYCCEEEDGSYMWKDIVPAGDSYEVIYSNKTKQDLEDILSLYSVGSLTAYGLYILSPYKLKCSG